MEPDRDQLIDCVRRCNLNNIEQTCKYCANCYLSNWDLGGFNCHDDLANEIISRLEADAQKIKELTEQSQKWQEAYDCADAACRELSSKCDELTEEIKDLEADYDRVYEQAEADIHGNMADGGTSCHWCMDKTKADTVRGFVGYLKKQSFCCNPGNWISFDAIDAGELDNYAKDFLQE